MEANLIVVPFRSWHYGWLTGKPSLEHGTFEMTPEILRQLEHDNSWTGVVDGEPIGCAGTLMHWPGRHMAWAYIREGSLRYMPAITRMVAKGLEAVKGRIEVTVRSDFPDGQRWAKRLGFEVETPLLRQYGPQGESHIGYVRVN